MQPLPLYHSMVHSYSLPSLYPPSVITVSSLLHLPSLYPPSTITVSSIYHHCSSYHHCTLLVVFSSITYALVLKTFLIHMFIMHHHVIFHILCTNASITSRCIHILQSTAMLLYCRTSKHLMASLTSAKYQISMTVPSTTFSITGTHLYMYIGTGTDVLNC